MRLPLQTLYTKDIPFSTPSPKEPNSRVVGSLVKKGGQATRAYAWGDEFESWRVNCQESGYGQPTPVHMHPGGATPDTGVWDLCGNVWEWSADWNENKYPWLKGGSYYQGADGVRASSRDRFSPWNWYYYFGLRCVVVPGSR